MTSYDGGTIRAAYELDLTPLEQNAQRALQILNDLQAKSAAIKAPASATAPALSGPDPAKLAADAAKAQAAAERSALALARAQAALAKETGDTARAVEILSRALEGVDQNSVAAINTQRQLARATAEVERGASRAAGSLQVLPRTIAGLSNEAAAAASGLVGLFAFENIARFGVEAGKSAVTLERTQAVLRAVAGDAATYDRINAIAVQNQRLFGGTLNDNLATLQQFTFIANRTGASIEEINAAAQLLAAVNPAEGIEGAGFALSELAAGDTTSIVERFNLSRAAINELKAEAGGDTAALLRGVTDILAEQGVTAEVLNAALTPLSQTYAKLGQEAEKATTGVGLLLAELAKEPAEGLTVVLQAVNELIDLNDKLNTSNADLVTGGAEYDEYTAAVQANNAVIEEAISKNQRIIDVLNIYAPALGSTIANLTRSATQTKTLTEDQRTLVRAIAETGTPVQDVIDSLGEYDRILGRVDQAVEDNGGALEPYRERLIALIAAGGDTAQSTENLINSYILGGTSADQFGVSLGGIETTLQGQRDATEEVNRELERNAVLLDRSAEAAGGITPVLDTTTIAAGNVDKALQAAAQAAFDVANAGGSQQEQSAAAARELLNWGQSGVDAVALLSSSESDLDRFTAKYFRLQDGINKGIAPPDLSAQFNAEVEAAITRATGSTADQLALVNAELTKALPLSEERKRLLVERARLEQQISEESAREFEAEAKDRDRLAKAAAREAETAANAAKRKAETLAKSAEREQERISAILTRAQEAREKDIEDTNRRIEDENKRHYDALARAQEDYALSASRDEEDFIEARQKLLAEGRRAEADELTRQFEKDRARAEEDEARRIARADEQNAERLTGIDEEFARRRAEAEQALAKEGLTLGGVQAPIPVPVAAVAAPPVPVVVPETPAPSAVAGGTMPTSLRIEFAPISVLVDGQQVAQAVYPPLEARLDAALAAGVLTVAVVAPPIGGQAQGVRGPRV
jgi:hypothetical protein